MIRAVLHWCDPSYIAAWKEIESKTISNMHIQAVLADKNLQDYISEIRNPLVKATLEVWKMVVKENKLEKDIKILKWCAYDSEFTPNQMDPSFKNWIDKGITSICGIVKEDEIMGFQTLKQMFHLENQDHYRHLQLRNFYTRSIKNQTPTTARPLIQLFVNAYKSETKKGVISQIYKSLHDLSNYSTKYIKERGRSGNRR